LNEIALCHPLQFDKGDASANGGSTRLAPSPRSRISAQHGRAEFSDLPPSKKISWAGINRRVGRSHHQKPLKIDMAARSRHGATITSRGE